MLRLARVRPNLPLLAPVLLCLVIESLYYAGLPFSFQYVIDVGLLGNDRRTLVLLISGLTAGAVLVALLGFLRDYLYARLTARVLNDVRTAMFDHLQTCQNKDGSWPAADGFGVGPVYATALWCIVLQLDHRSYPAWQPHALEGMVT